MPPESPCNSTRRLKRINSYTIRAKIGFGSTSTVYLGIDERSGQKCALKRIKLRDLVRSPAGMAQLEREVRLMRLFDHPNILKLIEVLHIPVTDEAYIVLEYADCGSLDSFFDRGESLTSTAVFSILKQILTAIKYLHDSGYVHQDIKPRNILIDRTGRAKLADFGIGHSFTSAAMVVGSPAYQAPEALNEPFSDDEDFSSEHSTEGPQKEDIWALGVTLYQLLFSKLPFDGDNLFEIVASINENAVTFPENCDPEVSSLIRRMLTVDPVQRIGVEELLQQPLIAGAPDLIPKLPDVPFVKLREGEIVEIEAKVCPDGFSFAGLTLSVPRRFSYHTTPRTLAADAELSGARWTTYGSHSDGEDDDGGRSAKN
jgi:serine/threonine-protein kinase 11